MTVTWRARAFLATAVDAEWSAPRTGFGRPPKHRLRRTMGDPEVTATIEVLRNTPAAIAAWSEGNAGMDLE
ncbi:MAG TPA: hypothetical protein VH440_10720, partial [Candidatus Limnocylindrales bacterium]